MVFFRFLFCFLFSVFCFVFFFSVFYFLPFTIYNVFTIHASSPNTKRGSATVLSNSFVSSIHFPHHSSCTATPSLSIAIVQTRSSESRMYFFPSISQMPMPFGGHTHFGSTGLGAAFLTIWAISIFGGAAAAAAAAVATGNFRGTTAGGTTVTAATAALTGITFFAFGAVTGNGCSAT
ncbi:hypothetical protein EBX93_11750 [bacterium]|nr:hypothetical protein [bacterium]